MKRLFLILVFLMATVMSFCNIYAYLGTELYGDEGPIGGCISVYDITNPAEPVEIFNLATDLNIAGAFNIGDYVYFFKGDEMFDSDSKIIIMDISDPTKPFIVKEVPLSQGIFLVAKKDNYLFSACWDKGMLVLDVSDPLNPKEVATLQITEFNMWQGVRDLSISGNYVYLPVSDGEGWLPSVKMAETKTGLVVADISDPTNPKIVSYFKKADWGSVIGEAKVHGNYVYCSIAEWGIDVVDVTDPSAPKFVSRVTSGTTFGSEVSGDYLYFTVKDSGMRILDISDPTNPEIVDRYFVLGASTDLVIHDNLLLMAGHAWGGILLDISDPVKPKYISTLPIPAPEENWVVLMVEK